MSSAAHSKGNAANFLVAFVLIGAVVVADPSPALAHAGDGTVTLIGGGWGHGVGLSQYGAQGQALEDPGITGAEIATHYYAGSSVELLTDVLSPTHFLLDNDAPLWIGLLQNRSSFRFIARGGNLEICQDNSGGACSATFTPTDGEEWSFVTSGSGCVFEKDDVQQGATGDCSASISWADGTTVELRDWSGRSVGSGTLKVRPAGSGFHVSVATEIEQYVAGIAEVPSSWEPAALDAQALAARSFGLAKAMQRETQPRTGPTGDPGLSERWQGKCWCHVRASFVDQVYVGWSREQLTNWADAVARTNGQVLTHPDTKFTENGVVEAFFSSSTSGVTEPNTVGFGSSVQYPYLVSVDDHWSADPDINPNASWSVDVSASDIMNELDAGFTELTGVALLNGPPGSMVRFTGVAGGEIVSVDVTGRWLKRFGLKSGQITDVDSTFGDPPEPPAGGVSVVGYRVDDGPSHDGTGNDSKGNNDGLAQCGETIELYVTARNDGGSTLTGVSAAMSESDAYVRILYNTAASYPNLKIGASAENPRDWDLRIDADTPNGHQFQFTLNYTTDQNGPASHTVTIPIGCGDTDPPEPPAGGVSVVGYRVDDGPSHDGTGNDSKGNNDGLAQCGETIELYVTARNDGGSTLTGVSAAMSESDAYVRILYNTAASYPNLKIGASAENPRDWDLRIDADTPNGHQFQFTLNYTTDQNGPASHTVTIPIGCGDTDPPEPPAGGVSVVGYRVDDGPSHDGTGNDSKGNNDGLAQCGETIELYVTARNDGGSTLTGVSAAMSESDAYVRILYNTAASYPNLKIGASAENPRDWDLRIDADTPNGHQFQFTLNYTTDQNGPASHTVTIPIGCGDTDPPEPPAGGVSVVGYRVDDGPSHDGTGNDSKGNNDGLAQCGETIELYVTARNDGGSTLTGVSAAMSESDAYVRILYNTAASYPNLKIGASAENPRDWDLRIDADTPNGHQFQFTLNYTTDQNGPASHTVTIPIGCGG